jgi:hypothetical protein
VPSVDLAPVDFDASAPPTPFAAPTVSSADAETVDQEKNIPPGLDLLRESMRGINIGAAAEAGRIGLNLPAYMSSDAMAAGSFEPEPQETLTQQLARRIAEIDARIAASQDNPDLVRALENQRASMAFGLEATQGVQGATQAINQAASDLAAATGEAARGAAAGATDIAGTAVSPFNPELAARLYAASRGMAPEGAAPEPVPEASPEFIGPPDFIGPPVAPEAARTMDTGTPLEMPEGGIGSLLPPAATGGGGTGGAGGVGGFGPIEGRIAQMLAEREKRAEQDKWLALAQAGMALMSSRQPTFAGALGEAGLTGLERFRKARDQYEEDRLGLMTAQERLRAARVAAGARSASAAGKVNPKEVDFYSDYAKTLDDRADSIEGRISSLDFAGTEEDKAKLRAQAQALRMQATAERLKAQRLFAGSVVDLSD